MKLRASLLAAAAATLASAIAAAQPAPAPPSAAPPGPPPGMPPGVAPVFPPGAPPAAAPPPAAPPAMAPPPAAAPPPPGAGPFPAPGAGAPPGTWPGAAPGYGAPPGGYYTPPPYYPQPYYYPAMLPPPLLPYEQGQTVPPGYQLKTRPVRSAVISGAIIFGTTYVVSLLTATTVLSIGGDGTSQFAPLFVPVVGPFIAVGTTHSSGAGTLWLVLDGLTQAAGATVLIYGLAAEEKYLQYGTSAPHAALDVLTHPQVFMGPGSGAVRWTF
jgi:hypothetical protein